MYIPPPFLEHDPGVIDGVIRDHPLATLTYHTPDGPDAMHLPLLLRKDAEGRETLLGHVAKQNPILRDLPNGDKVLAIFHGPQAYISPNWYPSKHETHRQVSTWNYQVVHVKGRVTFFEDVSRLRAAVALLTHEHETRTQEKPWRMADGDKEYIAALLQEIVGIEIEITSKVGTSKLSQNREERDKLSAIDALEKRGDHPCAHAMLLAMARKPQE